MYGQLIVDRFSMVIILERIVDLIALECLHIHLKKKNGLNLDSYLISLCKSYFKIDL